MEKSTEKNKNHIIFLDLLRVLAVLLVIWDHLIGEWLDKNEVKWFFADIVKSFIDVPLGIIQNFGFLGVVLFFLISGYVITHVSARESRKSFIIKRLFRIYPPFLFSIVLIIVFYKVYGVYFGQSTFVDGITLTQLLYSGSLLNYISVNHHEPINGVAWTLIIEMIFYVICFLGLPLLKKNAKCFILICSSLVLFVLIYCREYGDNFFLFASIIAYIPYLFVGQIINYYKNGKLKTIEMVILSLIQYYLIFRGIRDIHSQFFAPDNSYFVSFMYALLLFIIALLLNNKLRTSNIISRLADLSYSIYLNHGLGILLLTVLYPYVGYFTALIITLLFIYVICHFVHKYIEHPSRILARRMLKKG